MRRRRWIAITMSLLLLFGTLSLGSSLAVFGNMGDGSSGTRSSPSPMEQGKSALKDKDYPKAVKLFSKVVEDRPRDADALNMLAYAQRKSGQLDAAIDNYRKALDIRPRFPAAREYLGEAYLQAALEQLKTLESYGSEASKHRDDLKMAIQRAAKELDATTLSQGESNRDW